MVGRGRVCGWITVCDKMEEWKKDGRVVISIIDNRYGIRWVGLYPVRLNDGIKDEMNFR